MSAGHASHENHDALLDQMITQQRAKVLAIARAIDARLTEDDILSPQDIPELRDDPRFNYEDGLLAGLLSAQMAMRAEDRRRQG